MNVIEVRNISKSYGKVKALDDEVRFSVSSVLMVPARLRCTVFYVPYYFPTTV